MERNRAGKNTGFNGMTTPVELLIRSVFNATGINEATEKYKKLESDFRQLQATTNQTNIFNPEDFLGGSDVSGRIKARIASVRELQLNLKQAGSQAIVTGQQMAAIQFRDQIRDLDREIDLLRDLHTGFDDAGSAAKRFSANITKTSKDTLRASGGIDGMIGKLNEFAFGIFVTQSSFALLIGLVTKLADSIARTTAETDRLNATVQLIGSRGIDTGRLQKELRAASEGAFTLDEALQGTLSLARAGFPELAARSDVFAKIAVDTAKLTGEIAKADENYRSIIDGIVKGEPELLDNAGIIVRLTEINREYAESIGKSVQDLTERDRVLATARAVEQEGERIGKLADEVDSLSLPLQRAKTNFSEFLGVINMATIESYLIVVEGAKERTSLFGEALISLREQGTPLGVFLSNLAAHFSSLREAGVLLGSSILFISGTIDSLISSLSAVFNESMSNGIELLKAFNSLLVDPIGNLEEFEEALIGAVDFSSLVSGGRAFEEGMKNAADAAVEFFDRTTGIEPFSDFGGLPELITPADLDVMEDRLDELENLALEHDFSEAIEMVREHLDELVNPTPQDLYNTALVDALFEQSEQVMQILLQRNEAVQAAQEKFNDALSAGQSRLSEKLAGIESKKADKLEDIAGDLSDKLSEISSSANDDRENAQKESAKRLEQIEENHQKERERIERRYQKSRLSALIDRDARALFEAEQERKDALSELEKDTQQARDDEVEGLEEQLADIADKEAEKRADAQEAAEKRRRDAIEAAEKQRRDAQEAFEKLRRQAQEAYQRDLQEAEAAANKKRAQAQQNFAEEQRDLEKSLRDRILSQQAGDFEIFLSRQQEALRNEELTQQHLDNLLRKYEEFLAERRSLIASSTEDLLGLGVPPEESDPPPTSSTPSAPSFNQTQSPSFGQNNFLPVSGVPQNQRVVVQVRGDDTLEEIFKGMAYEAYIEVMDDI